MYRLTEKTKDAIDEILDAGINTGNVETLGELVDIYKDIKEVECMQYGNYGAYDSYGRRPGYDSYGRRGYDMKYRGYDHLDRMGEHYGRYMGDKERYGTNEDTKRSLKYMLESMEDFARMLREDAHSEEEVQMIRQTAQRIANM